MNEYFRLQNAHRRSLVDRFNRYVSYTEGLAKLMPPPENQKLLERIGRETKLNKECFPPRQQYNPTRHQILQRFHGYVKATRVFAQLLPKPDRNSALERMGTETKLNVIAGIDDTYASFESLPWWSPTEYEARPNLGKFNPLGRD